MAVSKYASYYVRLQTLRDFPSHIDIHNVAKAGLYYINSRDNTDDALRCAFCEFVVSNWTDADDPWELHAAFVPMCIHVIFRKGLEFVQKILRKDGCGGEESFNAADISMYARRLKPQDLTITGISGHLERKQHSASVSPSSQSGSVKVYRTYRGVQFRLPVNEDMQEEITRAESFTTMDGLYKKILNLTVLAAAGFYFTGLADSVKCYHCGEGFKNWKRTDDPWVEHARYAPSCMHVILTKGEEFVERTQKNVQGKLKRVMPTVDGKRKRRSDSVDDDDEVPDRGMERLRIHGLPDSCGVERCRPLTVGPLRGERLRAKGRLVADSSDRDRLVSCFKCHRRENRTTAVGAVTLCYRVWICESCNKHDRQCPVCCST